MGLHRHHLFPVLGGDESAGDQSLILTVEEQIQCVWNVLDLDRHQHRTASQRLAGVRQKQLEYRHILQQLSSQ